MRMPTDLDLLSLDAADAALDPSQRLRADAMLERIIAAPLTPEYAPVGARRQHRFSRKVIWVPVVAVAVAVGSIVIPGRGGSAPDPVDLSMAYASWTSTPSAVSAGDLEAVTQACRDEVVEVGEGTSGGEQGYWFDAATIPVAIAERRGDFVAVLFLQDNPDADVFCVATNRPGSSDVDDLSAGAGGGSGPVWLPPAGRITQGSTSQFGDQPGASSTSGAAGAGVVGVTIHAGPQVITATVKNGRYVAWWPGKAFADGPQQPSGQGGPAVILTYDVTLTDGTTKTNVSPARPA